MPATDKLLLDAWRTRRDPDAFGEIVRRHASMVYATCRRILRNDADAEDVTQDCFLRLAQAGNGVKSSLVGWLHWMATRRSLDYMKRESRRRRREAIASSEPRAKGEVSWAVSELTRRSPHTMIQAN